MTPTGADPLRVLLDTIESQRVGCELAGSPLYADLLAEVAADVTAGGPCGRLLLPRADRPFGDAILLRFLAAAHALVLAGEAPGLARHFPSVGGTPGPDAGTDLIATVEDRPEVFAEGLRHGVQTNEVGRSASLVGAFVALGRLGRPLRLLEVGASAGLNLRWDHFRYEAGAEVFGPPDSPLRFVDPFVGPPPDLSGPVQVAERRGCDLDPIDPATEAGRLRLRSFVWPDQPERRARLDAALEVASQVPVRLDRAGAVAWSADVLAEPVPGRLSVVVHSIMFQYLSPADRSAFLDQLSSAGRRATPDAPVAWLRMEPGGDRAEIRLTTWPGGTTRLLGRSGFHGPPVVWAAPS